MTEQMDSVANGKPVPTHAAKSKRTPAHAAKRKRTPAYVMVTGALWNNLSSVIPIGVNIFMTPFLIHGFGVQRWGLLALVGSISLFLGPLGGGLGGALGRYFALYAAKDDKTKTTQTLLTMSGLLLVLGLVATALSWWLAAPVMSLFHVNGGLRPQGVFLLRTLGILVMIGFLHNAFASVINARQRYAFTNTITIVVFGAGSLGLIVCVEIHAGLQGVAFVYIAQQVLASAFTLPIAFRYLSRQGLGFLSWHEVKEIARYAASIQLTGLIGIVNSEIDSLLIGGFFRLKAVAFYNAGTNLTAEIRNLTFNLLGPLGIHLTRTFADAGDDGTVGTFERLQRAWVIMSTGISVVALGSVYFMIVVWLGPQFSLGGEIAVLAMAGNLVNLWTGALTQYLAAVGRPDVEVRYAVIAMVTNVAATFALLVLGPLGVTGAGTTAAIFASLILVKIARRFYRSDITNFLRDVPILPSVLACAFTVGAEAIMRPHLPQGAFGLLLTGIPALGGGIVYGAAVLGKRSPAFLSVLVHRPFNISRLAELAFSS
jgi:O-antigen/teichoic acid export membrane protein